MNPFKKVHSTQSGFSLVELMVVVAIIGVLASVAVPNFQKYQARAKQTEAKIQLSSIFTMEKSFAMDQNTYTGCLSDLGFTPGAIGKAFYTIGFNSVPTTGCGPSGTQNCNGLIYQAGSITKTCTGGASSSFFTATAKTSSAIFPANTLIPATNTTVTATISNTQFLAGAVGNVFSTLNDIWTIDQDKNLLNTTPGI